MERRRREQRLKIDERQRRRPHVYRHRRPAQPRLYHPGDHLDDPLSRYGKGPARGQIDPLRQHHPEAGKGLRQQVPRIHEGGKDEALIAHREDDPPAAAAFIPPMDQIPYASPQGRQQAQAQDRRPEGQRAQKHPADAGGAAQGENQHPTPQQDGRHRQ